MLWLSILMIWIKFMLHLTTLVAILGLFIDASVMLVMQWWWLQRTMVFKPFRLGNEHHQMFQPTYHNTDTSIVMLSDPLLHLMMQWSSYFILIVLQGVITIHDRPLGTTVQPHFVTGPLLVVWFLDPFWKLYILNDRNQKYTQLFLHLSFLLRKGASSSALYGTGSHLDMVH
jgi:hypothetical protein